ncbi:macrolide 2'-phosphotransferase [Priestia megaterium]|uniref:macrolide 2'-phosphotransferase n=1 Tax=Priestia megaterium TaxID=1404 RepID=UPI000BF67165|nr:macrolide 2'-phosphotransferase [Priestia megaterium]PEU51584.1 macrolide 2'-phosphotransferase [Priestia megaterium]
MNKLEIKELAKRKGLNVIGKTMKLNESGLDFQVAHAEDEQGQKWILRIPRRLDSMAKANQEKMVLDAVNRYTAIQAPNWEISTDELIAYRLLDGVPVGTINPKIQNYEWVLDIENIPSTYYESFGRMLAELHQLPTNVVKKAGIKVYTATEARELMKEKMQKVKDEYEVRNNLLNRWEAWVANDDMWPNYTSLSHGDIHPGHILINHQSEVTGLIDWTEVAVTDVSRDFLAHYLFTGEGGLEKAITAYEKAGGKAWPLMKEHIIELATTQAITVAEFAKSSGMQEYKDMAQQMLGPIE